MLVIRMQRTGRKGHAMFRVVVQDSRRTPTSGNIVAQLGSYDPHAKSVILDTKKAKFFVEHGAQPSERVIRLLIAEGVTLPDWVKKPVKKERVVRNADKRRSTRPEAPAEPEAPASEAPAEEPAAAPEVAAEPTEAAEPEAEVTTDDAPAETATETPEEPAAEVAAEETPVTEPEAEPETPAEEPVVDPEAAEAETDKAE